MTELKRRRKKRKEKRECIQQGIKRKKVRSLAYTGSPGSMRVRQNLIFVGEWDV